MKQTARIIMTLAVALALWTPAKAASLGAGVAAYDRENFTGAAAIFRPLALAGNARAQSYLGFMYSTGRGVPQDYAEAAYWYIRAANQGDNTAQYMLGLMYDKGQGLQQNYIEAHKWLNLATAHAPPPKREYSARLRDALATKMTRGELATARWLALQWFPVREHIVARAPY
jgi:TPR repeat protein